MNKKTSNNSTNENLVKSKISAAYVGGLKAQTPNGQTGIFAVLDENGNVIDSGDAVTKKIWKVCLESHNSFWIGNGHLKVLSKPDE